MMHLLLTQSLAILPSTLSTTSLASPATTCQAITGEWCHEVIADYLATSEPAPANNSSNNSNDNHDNNDNEKEKEKNSYEGHTLRGYDTPSLFPGTPLPFSMYPRYIIPANTNTPSFCPLCLSYLSSCYDQVGAFNTTWDSTSTPTPAEATSRSLTGKGE